MKIKIRRIKLLTSFAGWEWLWRAYLDDKSWEIPIIVGDYQSQSQALEAGILAFKFSSTSLKNLTGRMR